MENQDNKFNKTIDQNSNNRVVSSDEKTNNVEKISLDELAKAKAEMKGNTLSSSQNKQENKENQFDSFKEQLDKLRSENNKEKTQVKEPVMKTKFDWSSFSPEKKDNSKSSETKKEEQVKKSKFDWNSFSLEKTNDKQSTETSQKSQSTEQNNSENVAENDTHVVATVIGDHDFDKLHIKLQIDPDTNIGTILTDPEAIKKLEKETNQIEADENEISNIKQEFVKKDQEEKKQESSSEQEKDEVEKTISNKHENVKIEEEVSSVKNDLKEEPIQKKQVVQEENLQNNNLETEKLVETKNDSRDNNDSLTTEQKTDKFEEEKLLKNEEVQQVQKISLEEIEKAKKELFDNKNDSSVSETQTEPAEIEKNEIQEPTKDENLEMNNEQKSSEEQIHNTNIEQNSDSEVVQTQEIKQENIEQRKIQENKTNELVQNQNEKQQISSQENLENKKAESAIKVEKINKEELFEDSDFEGMTDEEIVQEIERRKRLADLKQKYSEDNNKDPNDIGEYKKSLDFASNATIKQFKMRPPKKVIAISIISVFLAIAIAITTTLLVLKKPPEPAVLVSSRISQSKISHYVGDTIDLRGIYIEELYSDGSKQMIQVSDSIISEKSSNINDDLVVVELSENSYIRFTINGKTQSLLIDLDEMKMTKILSFEIYQDEIFADSKIKFDNILILAQITNKNDVVIGSKKMHPQNAIFKIEGQDSNLETDDEGILLYKTEGSNKVTLDPGEYNLIVIITENGTNFEYKIPIQIS